MSVSMDDPSAMRRRDDESSSDDVVGTHAKDLYETKTTSKVIRVLTVLAYLLSVSFAAILLSVYYIFIWDPPRNHPPSSSPLRDNASHWTASVAMLKDFTVPGDSTIRPSVTDTSPYSPPLTDDDDYSASPSTAATTSTTPYPPTQHHLTPENQTQTRLSKNTSKRIRGRDPE